MAFRTGSMTMKQRQQVMDLFGVDLDVEGPVDFDSLCYDTVTGNATLAVRFKISPEDVERFLAIMRGEEIVPPQSRPAATLEMNGLPLAEVQAEGALCCDILPSHYEVQFPSREQSAPFCVEHTGNCSFCCPGRAPVDGLIDAGVNLDPRKLAAITDQKHWSLAERDAAIAAEAKPAAPDEDDVDAPTIVKGK